MYNYMLISLKRIKKIEKECQKDFSDTENVMIGRGKGCHE